MHQAHPVRRPSAAAIVARFAIHLLLSLLALVLLWGGLVGFLLVASAL